jgi:aspartate ammonia-lyase
MSIRMETDSLGQIEVPSGALYGAQTARAVVNFPISGLKASPFLIRALGMVKRAAAEVNQSLGLITPEQGGAIVAAAQEVIDGKLDGEFVVDVFQAGAGVSLHMNANEVIANRAGQMLAGVGNEAASLGSYEWVHPNDHVNYGQSTNDVFPTAMRLSALLALQELYPAVIGLAGGFDQKAEEFPEVLKAGRTHMQDAVPVTLGQEFAAYAVAMRKAVATLARAAEGLRELGLGGSAVGTGLNTHPAYRVKAVARLSEIAGVELRPAEDLRWAMQSCGCMAEVSGALRGLALEMIRISNDLRLLSSGPNTGFNEIHLPSLQPGSSIMPGKVNPVLAELTAMVGFQVVGNDAAVAMAVQAGQLELNVMMPTMAHNVLQSVTILTNTLRELDQRCVRGITANRERCEFYAGSTIALATALNPYIGYAKAAGLVKESVATGKSIVELARAQGLMSEEQIREVLDPKNMTEPHA